MPNLQRTLRIIEQGMAQRLHIGAQLYVSLGGRIVADLALGEARAGVSMATDTLMPWLSAGKPLAAVAIAQLWEKLSLELDDPVARHIPPFAANGKDSVTIRHILTHTAAARTFGHGGSQSSMAFADPEHALAVAFVFNGMPGEPAHQARNRAVVTAIYEDLGLPSMTNERNQNVE